MRWLEAKPGQLSGTTEEDGQRDGHPPCLQVILQVKNAEGKQILGVYCLILLVVNRESESARELRLQDVWVVAERDWRKTVRKSNTFQSNYHHGFHHCCFYTLSNTSP